MNQSVLDYIKTQKACVLAVEMMDGAPHAATVHFASSDVPVFYFETNKNYRKAEPMLKKNEVRASLVIGSSEETPKTLQVDGVIRLIHDNELAEYEKIYLGRFPEKLTKSKDPNFLRLIFIPSWWRFSDFTNGRKIITSEDK